MTKLKMTSVLFSLAVMASPALAQDFVDAKIKELFAQGYTHFEVSRGFRRTEIEAYGPNFTKLEVQLSNADGAILSQRVEIQSQTEHSENVWKISQASTNVREELGDDHTNAHRESVKDDLDDDESNLTRYGSGNDDHYYNVDEDRYANHVNARDDEHRTGDNMSHDDGYNDDRDHGHNDDSDEDRDEDRDDDRDDDGHDSDGHDRDDD